MSIVVRPLDPAQWPAVKDLLGIAFNIPPAGWDVFRSRVGPNYLRIATRDGELVGAAGMYPMGQYWGGRSVPLGGIAGVGVAPHARGLGVARALMVDCLERLRADGVPMAGLYPATQGVYRKVGFEQSGERVQYETRLEDLSAFRREVEIMPIDVNDPAMIDVLRLRYRPVHGNLARSPAIWGRLLEPVGLTRHAWLIGDDGYVILSRESGDSPTARVDVVDLSIPSPATARTLLSFLAGHRSLVDTVRWFGSPADALLAFLPEPTWKISYHQRWMLRVVDVDKALVARGWPSHLKATLHMEVQDALLPANSGRRILSLHDGIATVTVGGRGDLVVPVASLGPLYSGMFDAHTLASLGWIAGNAATVSRAAVVFAAPLPWMREMY